MSNWIFDICTLVGSVTVDVSTVYLHVGRFCHQGPLFESSERDYYPCRMFNLAAHEARRMVEVPALINKRVDGWSALPTYM